MEFEKKYDSLMNQKSVFAMLIIVITRHVYYIKLSIKMMLILSSIVPVGKVNYA